MAKIVISGGEPLNGEVWISGAKNAVLPILASTLLCDESISIGNVPHLHDVTTTMELLGQMGAQFIIDERMKIHVDPRHTNNFHAPYDLVKTMRASILVLGPLVARYGEARRVAARRLRHRFASGRPAHPGLQALGAEITVENGYIHAKAKRLKGARVVMDLVTVTGTENIMMAAALARAPRHRERRAGARGRRSRELPECDGREGFEAPARTRSPSRASSACTARTLRRAAGPHRNRHLPRCRRHHRRPRAAQEARPNTLDAVLAKLEQAGAHLNVGEDTIELDMRGNRPKAVTLTTAPYPAFPTDMQAQFMP
jgi:UDP-N-acetylglucosamine 1-carboxyvinyltransferase